MESHGPRENDSDNNIPYGPLASKDFDEQEVRLLGMSQATIAKPKRTIVLLILPHVLLLGISIATVVYSVLRTPKDAQCAKVLSTYSPAFDAIEYETYTFQANDSHPSIYRGPPTPERETAWEELIRQPVINIPMEKLPLLNKSTEENWVRTPVEAGGGVAGRLEVGHQLHCLGLLRQWIYREWYPDEEIPPDRIYTHVDHCIETLRIHLVCASDVTPIMAVIDDSSPTGKRIDFDTFHKCRNFSKIQEWVWGITEPFP